jgi:lytic murein transglycosylase
MPLAFRLPSAVPRACVAAASLLLALSVRAEDFSACWPALREGAAQAGLGRPAWDKLTASLVPDMSVLALLDDQPEFKTPVWDYLAALVDDQRIADGQARMAQWQDTLAAASARFGVDAATVVAVWGVESDYGRSFGKRPLLTSLATLSCFGRRQAYFRGEFFSLLRLIDQGDLRIDGPAGANGLVGSWAGAFGHTQFMPSTYQRLAVDFDGDGRRDLVNSVPDALASTANFLQRAGWKPGQAWGVEVRLPDGLDAATLGGRKNKRSLADWAARGVRRVDGKPLTAPVVPGPASAASARQPSASEPVGAAGLLLPAGPRGPAFLVFGNFDAIYGYNASESYALAIAHLSDRLRGGPPFATAWPTDDAGLSRAERRELQTLLAARGHAIGEIDGMLGTATRAAIKAEQERLGRVADGRAGQRLLQALRRAGAEAAAR